MGMSKLSAGVLRSHSRPVSFLQQSNSSDHRATEQQEEEGDSEVSLGKGSSAAGLSPPHGSLKNGFSDPPPSPPPSLPFAVIAAALGRQVGLRG